jgi:AP-1-like transcription factor
VTTPGFRRSSLLGYRFIVMEQPQSKPQFDPNTYLSPDQQDLLLAALSTSDSTRNSFPPSQGSRMLPDASKAQPQRSPANSSSSNINSRNDLSFVDGFGDYPLDDPTFEDFLDGDIDDSFDVNDFGDQSFNGLPQDIHPADTEKDIHDKRKNPVHDEDEIDGEHKRRESEDKASKKPGRKPLTSEPTTVSKSL